MARFWTAEKCEEAGADSERSALKFLNSSVEILNSSVDFFWELQRGNFFSLKFFFGAEIIIHHQIRALVTEIQIEAALSIFQW